MSLGLFNGSQRLTRAILLVVSASLIPLPVFAEERSASKPGPITAAVEKIAESDRKTGPSARTSAAPRAQQAPGTNRSFFKTKPGIIALVVMAVGTGFAIYSTQNDRIESPGKQ